jgi:predicted transcriptional regulator
VSQLGHITEAESVVMGALWRLGPLTPPRLMIEVKAVQPWADTTIKTLLARLIQKKRVKSERHEGVVRYWPLVDRRAYVQAEIQALVDRLFEGDEAGLLAFLSDRAKAPALPAP